jgi:asparagine synthase (glutamine-hydrolysing)
MFAIALWDRSEASLTLLRDRMGIKPLYWGRVGRTLYFGSQPRAFFGHPDWRPEIDRGALAAYTRFGYVPGPASIFRGIEQVAPGHFTRLDRSGSARTRCYWDLRRIAADGVASAASLADEEAVDQFEALLRDSIRYRMLADVPVGALLSGGIDSSLVVALMQAQSNRPVKTFSIGFDEQGFDEAPHARAVARHLGTEHFELYVEPQHALDVIPQLSEWYDEPLSDSSQIPTYLVSRMAREEVTVTLSGDGGDELFAGYPRYAHLLELGERVGRLPRGFRRLAGAAEPLLPEGLWNRLGRALPGRLRQEHLATKLRRAGETGASAWSEHLYRDLVSLWHDAVELLPRAAERVDPMWSGSLADPVPDLLQRVQLIDQLSYLPHDILTKVDRASMAVSLEARVPLLDHRIVEWSWRLPAGFNMRGDVTKWPMREVLSRYVPRELTLRPKMGFGVPIAAWLRGPLRDWAEDLLDAKRLAEGGYLEPEPVRRRWREHLSGETDWHYPLWAILIFQDWRRRWGLS